MRYTKENIIRLVEEEDVEFIRLQFTDIYGNLKNMAVTASQLEKAIDNRCMFDAGCIQGYMTEDNDRIMLTDAGIDVSNYILSDFILDDRR